MKFSRSSRVSGFVFQTLSYRISGFVLANPELGG